MNLPGVTAFLACNGIQLNNFQAFTSKKSDKFTDYITTADLARILNWIPQICCTAGSLLGNLIYSWNMDDYKGILLLSITENYFKSIYCPGPSTRTFLDEFLPYYFPRSWKRNVTEDECKEYDMEGTNSWFYSKYNIPWI